MKVGVRGAYYGRIGLIHSEKGIDLSDNFDCFCEREGYSSPFERGLFLLSYFVNCEIKVVMMVFVS
jgi:hypothetical protein